MNLDERIAIWNYEHEITLRVIRRLPDCGLEFQPHPHATTSGKLAWHIVRSEHFFIEAVLAGTFQHAAPFPARPADAEAMAALLEENHRRLVQRVQELPEALLQRRIAFGTRWNYPAAMYLVVCVHHEIHHRGQLTEHLRLMGQKVPAIYGPSADEPAPALAIGIQ